MFTNNKTTPPVFSLALGVYFAVICLNPSWIEGSGLLTLTAGALAISNNGQVRRWLTDPAFAALLAFAVYSSATNAFGSGEIAHTAILYAHAATFLIGRAWGIARNNTLHRDMLFGAVALAAFVFAAQICIWAGLDRLDALAPALQDLRLTFRNAVRTAIFTATGGLVCLLAMLPPAPWKFRATAMAAGCALLSALIATGKRATLAALLVCSGGLLLMRGKKTAVAVIFAAAMALVFLLGKTERFAPNPDALIASQAERRAVWHAAVQIIREHPLTGSGFRTFRQAAAPHVEEFRASHAQTAPYEKLEDAHNLPLHILCESGICGLALICLVFFFPLRRCWRLRMLHPAAATLLGCAALILLNAQLHANLFSPNTGALTFLLTGAASALHPVEPA